MEIFRAFWKNDIWSILIWKVLYGACQFSIEQNEGVYFITNDGLDLWGWHPMAAIF